MHFPITIISLLCVWAGPSLGNDETANRRYRRKLASHEITEPKVSPEEVQSSTLLFDTVGAEKAIQWMSDVDSELNVQVNERMQGFTTSTAESDNQIRSSFARVFASAKGKQRSKELLDKRDPDFMVFNELAEERSKQLCFYLRNGVGVAASEESIKCICAEIDEPAISCAASLEVELEEFSKRRRRERRLSTSGTRNMHGPRELKPSCDISINGASNDFGFLELLTQLGSLSGNSSPISIQGECTFFPLFSVPLEARISVNSQVPGLSVIDGLNYEEAKDAQVGFSAEICAPFEDDLGGISDVLEFFGFRCPVRVSGSVHPMLDFVDVELYGAILFFFIRGNVVHRFSNENRELCNGINCLNDDAIDCAMCESDTYASGEFGVDLFFFSHSISLGKTDTVNSCAVEGPDSCTSGLGNSNGKVGDPCDLDNDCANDACGRLSFGGDKKCCPSGRVTRSGLYDYCTDRPNGTKCGGAFTSIDGMCSSGTCINDKCADKGKVGDSCDLDNDCANDACGRISFGGDKKCCPSGRVTRSGLYDYCTDRPDGTKCGGALKSIDGMCSSGTCIDDVCAEKGRVGDSCDLNQDCANDACGRLSFGGDLVCCPSGRVTRSGLYDYCTDRPNGTKCGGALKSIDGMCSSGTCIDDVCADKGRVGDSCDLNQDCANDACGRLSFGGDLVCCPSGRVTRSAGYDYCTDRPNGTKCGGAFTSINGMCAGGTCSSNRCTSKKRAGGSCTWNKECINNACAYHNGRKICCYSGSYYWKFGYKCR